ncbi:MAG: DUF1501 domain-containing protein [Verrucomicrobia bacterium]|nr:MAG: DUF1501 domain-containing protein [Verrucomicrobiota bacterium]
MNCQDHLYHGKNPREITRRWFFQQCGVGLGAIALGSLFRETGLATLAPGNPLAPKQPHFPAKAKRVIFLFMAGAPSHLELFDYKPQLAKFDGTLPPAELIKDYRAAFISPSSTLLGPKFKFAKHGQCGAELSELLPHLATVVDDIAIVKSMHTDAFNHAPGQLLMSSGTQQFGRPSMGAWCSYGLGTESQDLPAFVVFSTGKKGPSAGAGNWGPGFLPSVHQGTMFRSVGDPVLYLSNPKGVDDQIQRATLDSIKNLNQQHLDVVGDPEIATRINQFELAARMQTVAPDVMDITKESKETLEMYGAEPGKGSFANACLLARRMAEKGVRFIEIFHEAWDQHGALKKDIAQNCKDTDQAAAALIKDLKQRGMLDDTLVVWGGEFGRTPMVQDKDGDGRDHHPNCFTMWLAGGGVKRGVTIGESDDFGFNVTQDKVHVHDLHATMLHLLGFDHTKLTYRFQGRDFRLTDVHGELVTKLLA